MATARRRERTGECVWRCDGRRRAAAEASAYAPALALRRPAHAHDTPRGAKLEKMVRHVEERNKALGIGWHKDKNQNSTGRREGYVLSPTIRIDFVLLLELLSGPLYCRQREPIVAFALIIAIILFIDTRERSINETPAAAIGGVMSRTK